MKKREKSSHMKYVSIILVCLIVLFFQNHTRTKWREVNNQKSLSPMNLFYTFEEKEESFLPTSEVGVPIENTTRKTMIDLLEKQNLVTSGEEFKGHKIRHFPKNELVFDKRAFKAISEEDLTVMKDNNKFGCEKWGVMTTIFDPPSEALRRFMYRKDWCVVVVGDKGKPLEKV